jgi:hypothetical protein
MRGNNNNNNTNFGDQAPVEFNSLRSCKTLKHKRSHHPMAKQSSKEQMPQSCAVANKITKNSVQSTTNLALALLT